MDVFVLIILVTTALVKTKKPALIKKCRTIIVFNIGFTHFPEESKAAIKIGKYFAHNRLDIIRRYHVNNGIAYILYKISNVKSELHCKTRKINWLCENQY